MTGYLASSIYHPRVLKRIAAITPGTQPHKVRMNTRRTAPQPLSMTASGGQIMHMMALIIPMFDKNDFSKVLKTGTYDNPAIL